MQLRRASRWAAQGFAGFLTTINGFPSATVTMFMCQHGEAGMEFHIRTRGASPNLDAINAALLNIDPTAVADIEPGGASLRVAAALSSPELIALLTQAGYPVDWKQLEEVPSVCCGACGG
jgi:hypothetical protein